MHTKLHLFITTDNTVLMSGPADLVIPLSPIRGALCVLSQGLTREHFWYMLPPCGQRRYCYTEWLEVVVERVLPVFINQSTTAIAIGCLML